MVGDSLPKVEKKNKSRKSTCQNRSVVGNLTPKPHRRLSYQQSFLFETPLGSARNWHARRFERLLPCGEAAPERSPPHESGAK